MQLQPKLKVNSPNDRFEQEADRVANQVVSGRRAAITGAISPPGASPIQRQESKPVSPKPNNYDEAKKKILDAFLETDLGKQLKAQALAQGKEFLGSIEGKVIAGGALGGTLAALIASNSELPMQIPELPLDFIAPGLKAKITWEGPIRAPTSAGLTLTSKGGVKVSAGYTSTPAAEGKPAEQKGGISLTIPLGGSAEKPKSKETASEKYRAETAQIAAEQQQFREGMKSPGEKAEDKQFWDSYWRMKAKDALNPLATPGAGLQLAGEKKKEEEPVLQRKSPNEANFNLAAAAPPIVHEVLGESGQPLDSQTRSRMEEQLGYNFGQVRIHRDARAAESARAVSADAYTVGHHVVFDNDRYSPATTEGQRLLAHELVHVIQQGESKPSLGNTTMGGTGPLSVNGNALHQRRPVTLARQPNEKPNQPSPGRTAGCQTLSFADFKRTPPTGAIRAADTEYDYKPNTIKAGDTVTAVFDSASSWVQVRYANPTDRKATGLDKEVSTCENFLKNNPGGSYDGPKPTGPKCAAAAPFPDTSGITAVSDCEPKIGAAIEQWQSAESPRLLKHEQFHLNLACTLADKTTKALASGKDAGTVGAKLMVQDKAARGDYDNDTAHGCKAAEQTKWEGLINGGLTKYPIP